MNENLRSYENFLEYRKKGNNWEWVSRDLNHQLLAFKQKKLTTPEYHKRGVLKSPKIQELLDKLSVSQNIPKSQLEKQVIQLLDEIGYKKNWKLLRWLGLALTRICLTVSSGIYANKTKIEQIKSTMGHCPVIFVPSHRSYVDFILMSYVCFTYDIAIPAIAAGTDFQRMVGMSSVLRYSGAFFMRRSYNDDSLYWTTFKQYVYQLTTKGDLPIEFFIEGTRSRSNKTLTPKFGMLTMLIKAFFFAQVPDILFVPINVSYDRLFEESLFAYELLGVPKPRESTSGFFKSMKILKENFGNIYYTFDDPISAKDFFGDKLDRSAHNMGPLHLQELTQAEKNLLPPLANEIVHRQQRSTVVTTFNLMAVVMNYNLSIENNIEIGDLVNEINWLKSLLEALGAFVQTEDIEKSLREIFIVHSNLISLDSKQHLHLVRSNVKQGVIDPKKLKAYALSDETMTKSVPFVILQIYVNPILQFVVDEAFLVTILSRFSDLTKDDLYSHYHFLRRLHLLEFVTFESRLRVKFDEALSKLISFKSIKCEEDRYSLGENEKLESLLLICIKPFLYSYSITLNVMKNLPNTCDEKTILANTQMVIEKDIIESKDFIHPYCLNLDTLGNCLGNLVSIGTLAKTRRGNKNIYHSDRHKLEEICRRIDTYVNGPIIEQTQFTVSHQQNKL